VLEARFEDLAEQGARMSYEESIDFTMSELVRVLLEEETHSCSTALHPHARQSLVKRYYSQTRARLFADQSTVSGGD
jgi:hypothetical protein